MICISISELGYDNCLKALRSCEKIAVTRKKQGKADIIVEIRLDLCGLNSIEVQKLFQKSKVSLIATGRRTSLNQVKAAITSGAKYIEIDRNMSALHLREIIEACRLRHVKVIFSYADYGRTPKLSYLLNVYRKAIQQGADVVHISSLADTKEKAEHLLALYKYIPYSTLQRVPLILEVISESFNYARLEALTSGSPFIYCSLRKNKKTSEGQFSYSDLLKLESNKKVSGDIIIPSSKSIAQRAICAAAISEGVSNLYNFSGNRDTDSALSVLEQIGSQIRIEGKILTIKGLGFPFKMPKNKDDSYLPSASLIQYDPNIFVGESGILARLVLAIAAQFNNNVTISGEGSLMGRTLYGCKHALELMGAQCILTAEYTLPASVCGPLKGGDFTLSGTKGSQLISGLLMALPLSKKDTKLTLLKPKSIPYIRITLEVLKKFGINIQCEEKKDVFVFDIPGKQKYQSVNMLIEGDWSSAANFCVMGAVFGDITLRGLLMDSHQADIAIIKVLKQCGANIEYENGVVSVHKSHLFPFVYDTSNTPDILPILTVLAAFCEGTSVINGINRLVDKGSSRADDMAHELKKMGVNVFVEDDKMIIEGFSYLHRKLDKKMFKGESFSSHIDHRIAMALFVASIACNSKVKIEGADYIDKSYVDFKKDFDSVIH